MLQIEFGIFFSKHFNIRIKHLNVDTNTGRVHLQPLSLLPIQTFLKYLNKISIFQLRETRLVFKVEEDQKIWKRWFCYVVLLSVVCESLSVELSVFNAARFGKPSLVTFCCDASDKFASCEVSWVLPCIEETLLACLGCLAPNMVLPTRTFVLPIKIWQIKRESLRNQHKETTSI